MKISHLALVLVRPPASALCSAIVPVTLLQRWPDSEALKAVLWTSLAWFAVLALTAGGFLGVLTEQGP